MHRELNFSLNSITRWSFIDYLINIFGYMNIPGFSHRDNLIWINNQITSTFIYYARKNGQFIIKRPEEF